MRLKFTYCFFVFLLLGLLMMAGCGDIEFLAPLDTDSTEDESLAVEQPVFIMYKAGKRDKVVIAEEGKLYEEQRLLLYNPRIEYFENGKFIAELTAQEGELFLQQAPKLKRDQNDAVLSGNVVYKNIDGAILKTEKMVWDDSEEIISSEADFLMEMPRGDSLMILEGKRFETDKTLTKWKDHGASIRKVPLKS